MMLGVIAPDESSREGESRESPPSGTAGGHALEHSEDASGGSAALVRAYEERGVQLHDARGALAEAVAALTVDLDHLRNESATLLDERDRAVVENRALRERAERADAGVAALGVQIEALAAQVRELEAALGIARSRAFVLEEMKVVRYTAWPRRLILRLRSLLR
jgi:chromosome segregation ATPase